MKTIKTKLLLSAMAVVISISSFAQASKKNKPIPPPEKRAEKQTERFASKLAFNEDQKKKVYELNLQKAKQHDADKAKCGQDQNCLKEARKVRMKTFSEQLKALLTQEQLTKLEELKKEKRANKKGNNKSDAAPGKPRPENELKDLDADE